MELRCRQGPSASLVPARARTILLIIAVAGSGSWRCFASWRDRSSCCSRSASHVACALRVVSTARFAIGSTEGKGTHDPVTLDRELQNVLTLAFLASLTRAREGVRIRSFTLDRHPGDGARCLLPRARATSRGSSVASSRRFVRSPRELALPTSE